MKRLSPAERDKRRQTFDGSWFVTAEWSWDRRTGALAVLNEVVRSGVSRWVAEVQHQGRRHRLEATTRSGARKKVRDLVVTFSEDALVLAIAAPEPAHPAPADWWCCGGSDENPPNHTQDCQELARIKACRRDPSDPCDRRRTGDNYEDACFMCKPVFKATRAFAEGGAR